MKLLGSTKGKITKDKNGENVSYLEITEVMLLIIVINKIKEFCIHLFTIVWSIIIRYFTSKFYIFNNF